VDRITHTHTHSQIPRSEDIQYPQLSTVMCFLLKPIGITTDPFHQGSPVSRNYNFGTPRAVTLHLHTPMANETSLKCLLNPTYLAYGGADSSVDRLSTGYTIEKTWFDFRHGKETFLFPNAFRQLWPHSISYSAGTRELFPRR
jgi:hypothetical protein